MWVDDTDVSRTILDIAFTAVKTITKTFEFNPKDVLAVKDSMFRWYTAMILMLRLYKSSFDGIYRYHGKFNGRWSVGKRRLQNPFVILAFQFNLFLIVVNFLSSYS